MNNGKKPVTMADIAKICNVSIAAVSYTLNGKHNSRIPEETKQKILQIANLYQYRLNPYAKALATGELRNVLFFYESTTSPLLKGEILNFIDMLSDFLKKHSYNLIVAPKDQIDIYNNVDAILTYRISKKTFKDLANKNFCPVVCVDTHIDDGLFFEVINNFENLVKSNETINVSFSYNDEEINESLTRFENVYLINDVNDLMLKLTPLKDKKINCLNKEIYDFLNKEGFNCTYSPVDTITKIETIFEVLKLAMSRSDYNKHKFII